MWSLTVLRTLELWWFQERHYWRTQSVTNSIIKPEEQLKAKTSNVNCGHRFLLHVWHVYFRSLWPLPWRRLVPLISICEWKPSVMELIFGDGWFLADEDWGRLMATSGMLDGGRRVRFFMRWPYCTLDRRSFRLRMIGMLLALSASCVFPLRLYASLPLLNVRLALLTDESQLSRSEAFCRHDWWLSLAWYLLPSHLPRNGRYRAKHNLSYLK